MGKVQGCSRSNALEGTGTVGMGIISSETGLWTQAWPLELFLDGQIVLPFPDCLPFVQIRENDNSSPHFTVEETEF